MEGGHPAPPHPSILQICVNIWEIFTIPIKNPATFNTSTPPISMVGQCLSCFQLANSNRLTLSPAKLALSPPAKSKGYLLEVEVKYLTDLLDSHSDLPFMCDKMKINKVEKLVPNLKDKKNYVIHIRVLDQALRHGLVLERIHRAIEFNQRIG